MTFTPKHLFVPVDADAGGDRELAARLVDVAVDLARKLGAKLTLAHVAVAPVPPVLVPSIDATGEAYRAMADVLDARNDAASRELDKLVERARARGAADVDALLIRESGTIPEVLVNVARKVAADLIVMATHARKGLKRLVLGSVAERTAHVSSIPVLLLPAHAG